MIADPPLLAIRRRFPRPDAGLVAAFRGVPTGFVVDALGGRGGLDAAIKPILPVVEPLIGVALTCDAGPSDNLALFGALGVGQPGDVVMAATDASRTAAVTGDLLLGMMRNSGFAGFVTDGLVRDLPGIRSVGLPVYAAGVTPNSPARNGPGTVGLPIVLGGVAVSSGDIVVADEDGVVIVPLVRAAEIVERLADVRVAEAKLDAAVKDGLRVPDFVARALSGRVAEID